MRLFGLMTTIIGIILIWYGTSQYRQDKTLIIRGNIENVEVIDGNAGLFNGVMKHRGIKINIPLTYDEYEMYKKHGNMKKTYVTNTFDYYQDYNDIHPGTEEGVIMSKGLRMMILILGIVIIAIGLFCLAPELCEGIVYIPLLLIEGLLD